MACLPCQRQQFGQLARSLNVLGMARAVKTGVAINVNKLKGVDVNAKYDPSPKARPYQRKAR